MTRTTAASQDNVAKVFCDTDATVECSTPNIATVGPGGELIRVSNGTAVIYARKRLVTKRIDVPISHSGGQVSDELDSFVAGSLAASMTSAIDSRIVGKTAAAMPMYSTWDDATATYVRNASCWAADIDLTCISVWNSRLINRRGATAITPIHVRMASHFSIDVGDTVRFAANDGTVITRELVARAYGGGAPTSPSAN